MAEFRVSDLPRLAAPGPGALIEIEQDAQSWSAAAGTVAGGAVGAFPIGVFGAKGDGVTDDLAAVLAAMAAAAAAGGGTVMFGPKTYAASDEFFVPNGVALQGIKGRTKLTFAGANHWTTNSGWIKSAGTYAASVSLTRDLLPTPAIVPRLVNTSTTRVGTVVNAVAEIAHGLIAGDLIWVSGQPATPGQGVFFSTSQPSLSANRTFPFVVATVPTSTTFTYTVADTGDTVLTTLAIVFRAADVAVVASTAGFAVGQTVSLRSEAYRQNVGEKIKLGEFQKIARIISPTWLLLHSEAQDKYLVSEGAALAVATMNKNFSIKNIEVIGRGPNDANVTYGDRGVVCYLCENPEIEDCIFTDVDQICTIFHDCTGGRAVGNLITFNAMDEAGFASGHLDIQYGIGYAGCTTGMLIQNNTIFGGRHGIVQTGAGAAAGSVDQHGVARGISIIGNTLHGQWLGSISSHQSVDTCVISGNAITGTQCGINMRFGRNMIINDNTITSFDQGINVYQVYSNLKIQGNNIRASGTPILLNNINPPQGGSPTTDPEPDGPVDITGNTVIGGDRSVYIIMTATPRRTGQFNIIGNTLQGSKYEAIRISYGSSTVITDGWTGRISGNTFYDIGALASNVGMFLTNMRGGSIDNNVFHDAPATFTNAIYLDGAGMGDGTTSVMNNVIPAGLCTGEPLRVILPRQVLTDMAPNALLVTTNVALVTAGVATPRMAGALIALQPASGVVTNLDTLIAGNEIGRRRILRSAGPTYTVNVRHGVGNIATANGQTRVLAHIADKMEVLWTGTAWEEIYYANHNAIIMVATGTPVTFGFTATPGTLPAGATLTRASIGWYVDASSTLSGAATNEPRWNYDGAGVLEGLLIEPARTNVIRNNAGVGAVPGEPGTLPTNWLIGGVQTGLTRTVVGTGTEDGIPYVDIRFAGTAPTETAYSIECEARLTVAASVGQTWSGQFYCKLQAGSLANIRFTGIRVAGYDMTQTFVEGVFTPFILTSNNFSRCRVTDAQTIEDPAALYVNAAIIVWYAAAPIDLTLRIGGAGLALGDLVASPILTSGAAVTRAADVLSLSMVNGMYNVAATRLNGVTSRVVSVSGGTMVVPVDPSPLRSIVATPVG